MTVVQPRIWGTQDIAVNVVGVDRDSLSMLPGGGYVVTWRQSGQIGFQMYDGNGDKTGGAHFVGTPVQGQQFSDVLAYNSDGSFVVTWTEGVATGTGRTLRSQKFNFDGTTDGVITDVTGTAQGDGAQLSTNGQGGWVTAWIDNIAGTSTVRLIETKSDGQVGTLVSVAGGNGVVRPDVAWLGGSKYVVSYVNGTTGSFQIVDGASVGAATTMNGAVTASVTALKNPDGSPNGDFVVVSDNGSSATATVAVQRYHVNADNSVSAAGSALLVPVGDGTYGRSSAYDRESVTALKDGGYAFAYVSRNGGDSADIFVKVVDNTGIAGPAFKVHNEAGVQVAPTISEMADGRLSVSWHNPSAPTNGSAIESTIVDARASAVAVTGTVRNDIYAPSKHAGDVLDGGAGIDTLTFKGAEAGIAVDLSTESGSAGDAAGDTYKNFENVIGSSFNDTIVGGVGANKLDGGAGNDYLDGGADADLMIGGTGSDIYIVNHAADAVQESAAADGGIDTVHTSVSHALEAYVENMLATGSDAITLTGNDLSNTLTGNGANNTLAGGGGDDVLSGGAGADVMDGGAGNDTYYVDDPNDVVQDSGGGIDTVVVTVNYDLSKLVGIENITGFGSGAITLTGTTGSNMLTGNDGPSILYGGAGNDTLNGGGGNDRIHGQDGRDVLTGGLGRDIFVFDRKPTKANIDKIMDFRVVDDSIYLENKYFKVGSKGSLSKPALLASKMFYAGAAAHDADDRIIYNKTKGILYYDPDGNGSAAAVQIATLSKKLKMTYKDFFVI